MSFLRDFSCYHFLTCNRFTFRVHFSTTSDFVLRAVPHISDEYTNQASKIRVAFTGDPSFFAYNGEEEEPEPEDPDAPPVERFREVHRLAYTVKVSFSKFCS